MGVVVHVLRVNTTLPTQALSVLSAQLVIFNLQSMPASVKSVPTGETIIIVAHALSSA